MADTVLANTLSVIITCQDCQSQYEVADEKVHGRSVRIRCRACGSRIFLSLEATTPSYGDEPERLPCPSRETRNAIAPPRDESADATAPRNSYQANFEDQTVTGGRNETSVLFTLAALSGSRKPAKAPAAAVAPTRQDSGLIDLNAMSTSGAELSARNVKAPVLSEPPLGNFTTSVSYVPPAKMGRAHFYGAGIAAVALLAMIGLGFGMRGEKIESADVLARATAPVVHAAAVAQPVAAPVVTPAPAAPAPEVVASNTSDLKPAAASKGKGKKGGKKGSGVKPSGLRKIASTGVSSTPSAAPAAKPVANDPCHCKGNLMCSMNCSAK